MRGFAKQMKFEVHQKSVEDKRIRAIALTSASIKLAFLPNLEFKPCLLKAGRSK